MSTAVWPPIPHDQLLREEEATLARELAWLLSSLQETLQSLKAGLEACVALLAPQESGSTLVLSSHRSESLKGYVTRVGTRIVKGDVTLKLASLPPPRGASSYRVSISSAPHAATLVLDQLVSVRTLINTCLDVVDISAWTGDAKNADFIAGQLRLLYDNIQEAKQTLKGSEESARQWLEKSLDEKIFDPPLPPTLSFHISISDAALLLQVRTLQPASAAAHTPTDSITGLNIRDRLSVALGGPKAPLHDEAGKTFAYRGQEVRVREKVRVESQDPSLMAAMAKLSALEHTVALSRRSLEVVMGRDE